MTHVYITSTLRTQWNRTFNPELCDALKSSGITCYLPQRDTNQEADHHSIFKQNLTAMQKAQKILVVAENESVNWGVETGFAYGIKKPIIALMQLDHELPLMASFMFEHILRVDNLEAIDDYLTELSRKICQ